MKSTINGVTTYFVGNHYEVANGVVTKYYFAGTQRIAMRKNGTLTFMLTDHLGSTSLTTSDTGVVLSEMRYSAWGEVRYQAGITSTGYQYTGQYSNTADFGLMYYNARWYDPALGRFAQADTIVPGGVQGYDRYAYGLNNPSRYTDPSGHSPVCEDDDCVHNYPTNGGGNKDKNKEEGCKGLECIHNRGDDNDITLPIGVPANPRTPESGPDWRKIAIGVGVVLIGTLVVGTIIAGIILSGPAAPVIVAELLVSSEVWMSIALVGGTSFIEYQGFKMIGEGIQGK